jgi:uncharacterized protein YgiM (DUF1202 family)
MSDLFTRATRPRVLRTMLASIALLGTACASAKKPTAASRSAPKGPRVVVDTVIARDAELEKRMARLELQLLERDAQVEDLQARLEDARAEVVRAMAKLRTVASRAEAASGMAEAEVSLQSLKSGGTAEADEIAQVWQLVKQSAAEFNTQNYGGALYLANQAKALSTSFRGRSTDTARGGSRAGETAFALPIRLRVANRGNIRQGPGTNFSVAFAVESGTSLMGLSYTDEWIRVTDDSGRSGWIFRSLVGRP